MAMYSPSYEGFNFPMPAAQPRDSARKHRHFRRSMSQQQELAWNVPEQLIALNLLAYSQRYECRSLLVLLEIGANKFFFQPRDD